MRGREAGEIPGLAARRFTLEEAQARADLGRAEARLAAARGGGGRLAPGLPPDARPAALAAAARPAGALRTSRGRPDLVAREREIERAEALRRLSQRIFEAPALGLGWKRVEEAAEASRARSPPPAGRVPLFDRRQADRREAEARLSPPAPTWRSPASAPRPSGPERSPPTSASAREAAEAAAPPPRPATCSPEPPPPTSSASPA